MMDHLPPLDAHVHLDSMHASEALADSGAVLAMTLSIDEAALVVDLPRLVTITSNARSRYDYP